MPKVSVIVPNFNHLKYLPERLQSILGQTFQDFELILLDDCSTDGSAAWLEDFRGKEKVSAVILGEANSGSAFKQWKKGFEAASGELVWIAESDDSCAPELLETLVAEFDRHSDCVLAFCASMLTDEGGSPLGVHRYQKELGRDLHLPGREFVRKWLLRNNYVVNASGALLRKSALSGIDDSFMRYSGVGDWLFWAGISLQGSVSFVNRPLNFFRQHGSNTTASLKRSGKALLELRSLLEDFERLGLHDRRVWLHDRIYAVHTVKYGPQLPQELKSEVLRVWKDDAWISFLALLKEIKHRISVRFFSGART